MTPRGLAAIALALRGAPGSGTPTERLRSIPAMLADAYTRRWCAAPRGKLTLALLGLVYVISPLDLVPDVLLPLGLLDDAAIAASSVAYLLTATDRWRDSRQPHTGSAAPDRGDLVHGEGSPDGQSAPPPAPGSPIR